MGKAWRGGLLRGVGFAGALLAGFTTISMVAGDIALAQTSEMHTQGRNCRNLGKTNKVFERNFYVYFDTNSSRVDPKYQKDFEHIYKLAKGQKAQQICLFGKSSKTGNPAANAELSRKRAKNVADAFVALGWPAPQIAINAEGEAWGWLEETLTWDAKEDRRVRIRLSR
ncbi:MAG: OmpA family protein [Parvibaculum sp.]